MFFIVSKLFWYLAAPLHFSLICLGAGLAAASRWSLGMRLAIFGATLLALMSFSPLGSLLLRPLEDRFPRQSEIRTPPKGIIVLGGAVDERIARARGQTLAQMALAWLLRFPEITSALIGASKVSQVEENVAALSNLEFSAEELKRIDGILG